MVFCWRTKAKSTWGRTLGNAAVGGRWVGSVGALTGGVAEPTLELAVVTAFSAGISRLWPAGFSLTPAGGGAAAEVTADVDTWRSVLSHGKWCSSKGRLVFQTAKTKWSSLRM